MAKTEKSVVIRASPEKVFAVISDYEKYPEFLPEVKQVKVVSGQGDIKDVTYTVDIKAKVISYTLRHTARPPHEVAWTMVRGEMIRSEERTSELQSPCNLVCRLLLEKKKDKQ